MPAECASKTSSKCPQKHSSVTKSGQCVAGTSDMFSGGVSDVTRRKFADRKTSWQNANERPTLSPVDRSFKLAVALTRQPVLQEPFMAFSELCPSHSFQS